MDLSIIIVNWNTKDLLIQCLESVYQTIKKIEMEVFVVDNGSTDGSVFAARERFPEVKFIQNQMNLGFARANNQAFSLSKGRYLLLLNPDTQVKEGGIEKLISFMYAHSEAGVAGAQLLNLDGSKQNSIANFPSLATELVNKSLLRRLFPKRFPGKERDYAAPLEVDSVIGACMIVRREAIEPVGLLDEDYFLFLEETDWCFRIKRAGWKIYHVPQAEIYHFQGKGVAMEKEKARVEYCRSLYHFFKKNRGNLQWFILLIGSVIKLMVELVFMGIASLFTCFTISKWKRRFLIYAYLMGWHLKGCPKGMGLKLSEGRDPKSEYRNPKQIQNFK
jgi:GT2 family glycosyltransferase